MDEFWDVDMALRGPVLCEVHPICPTAVSPQLPRSPAAEALCYAPGTKRKQHRSTAMNHTNYTDNSADCPDHGPYVDDDCPKC